jgi:hypothetical protein
MLVYNFHFEVRAPKGYVARKISPANEEAAKMTPKSFASLFRKQFSQRYIPNAEK